MSEFALPRAPGPGSRRGDRGRRSLRRGVPRRRHRAGHPARGAELRRRHRRRRRRDRVRELARGGTRRAREGARQVRHRRRPLRRRRAGRRRHGAHASRTSPRARSRPSRRARSKTTSSAATSRSTRWPRRWRATTGRSSSIPSTGRADLDAGRIRVLHDRSFLDDPTRIFRAIRYENRYGFRMDEHTATLAHDAVALGHVHDLSGARMREELIALFEEGDVDHAIPRLAELGVEQAIHHHAAADAEAAQLDAAPSRAERALRPRSPAWRLGLDSARAEAPARRDPGVARRAEGTPAGREPDRGRDRRRRRGSPNELAKDGLSRPTWSRSPSPTRPTRRSSPSLSPTCRALHEYFERLAGIRLAITRRGRGGTRPGRVAASGGDPRRAAPPEAGRRARRPGVGARRRARAGRAAMSLPVFRWEAPGPYEVVFSTRLGGVSEGPFESLNLGRRTGDDVERVDENRSRACARPSAPTRSSSRSGTRPTPRSSTARRRARGAFRATASGRTSPACRWSLLGADCAADRPRAHER